MTGGEVSSFAEVRTMLGLDPDMKRSRDQMLEDVEERLTALQSSEQSDPDHARWVSARKFLKDPGHEELVAVPTDLVLRLAPNPDLAVQQERDKVTTRQVSTYHGRLVPAGAVFATLMFLSGEIGSFDIGDIKGVPGSLIAQMYLVALAATLWLRERRRVLRLEEITRKAYDLQNHGRILSECAAEDVSFTTDEFAQRLGVLIQGDRWTEVAPHGVHYRDQQAVFDGAAEVAIERFRQRGWVTLERGHDFTDHFRAHPETSSSES